MAGSSTRKEVGECAPTFVPDELDGFEQATLELEAEDDGQLVSTLVRTRREGTDSRPAVLYVHGFVDYFFQTHLAEAFENAGFRFYALELRRYGRSLRPKNRPCQASAIEDYFAELDWAIDTIRNEHPRVAALVAHSTGGLVSCLYLNSKTEGLPVDCLILNSPFLRFNLSRTNRVLSWLVARAARLSPHTILPQKLGDVYGRTLHKSCGGEWDYDLGKKPIAGFPLYAGWFRMIRRAHAKVRKGLNVRVPILSLYSDNSRIPGKDPTDADRRADLVLNVQHIRDLSPRLGERVTLQEIPGGVHDLTLSREEARNLAISQMVAFAEHPGRLI